MMWTNTKLARYRLRTELWAIIAELDLGKEYRVTKRNRTRHETRLVNMFDELIKALV